MRLGFFGGSFDPPHRGHLAVAQGAARYLNLDQVLLAPTGRQPMKQTGPEASFSDRLAMVGLLCSEDARRMAPSAIDAPHADGSPNFTVDALSRLAVEHPTAEIYALIGVDSLLDLPRWQRAARLFELATWAAISRPGHSLPWPLPDLLQREQDRGRLLTISGIEVAVSSTELRRSLRRGDACGNAAPESVARYIQERKLYSSGARD